MSTQSSQVATSQFLLTLVRLPSARRHLPSLPRYIWLFTTCEPIASSATSPRLTLQGLPDDISVEILDVSDEATLVACESVSDCFHCVIQSVHQLAYHVVLEAAGMRENAVPAETTASQRHPMLQNHICTWLEPVVVDISPLLPSEAAWQ
ncbi:hypothetical protein EDB19DRAFT_657236 [Suillus lakei]|nr:hypothetical protein EDB19DRAFT_657236 [Suillus lakei]